MALDPNMIFVIFDTADPGSTAGNRRFKRYLTGPYDASGAEPDARPLPGEDYDPLTEGWMAVADFPLTEPPETVATSPLQAVSYTVNATAATVTASTGAAPLAERQRATQKALLAEADRYRWTQAMDARVTVASRDAAVYISRLEGLPDDPAWAALWGTNPEGVWSSVTPLFPTPPVIVASAFSVGQQLSSFSNIDLADDPWTLVSGNASAVSYPVGVTGITGNRILQVAGKGARLRSDKRVPFDPTKLHKITTRVRRVGADAPLDDRFFLGLMGYDANGSALTTLWCVARSTSQGSLPQDGWVSYVVYVKGTSAAGADNGRTVASPSTLPTGTVSFGGEVYFNYDFAISTAAASGAGTMQLDYFDIEVVDTNTAAVFNSGLFGDLQSLNFAPGTAGWRLGPSGVEFNTDVAINGRLILNNTVGIIKQSIADRETLLPEFCFDEGDPSYFVAENGTISFPTAGRSGGYALRVVKTSAIGADDVRVYGIPANYTSVREGVNYTWEVDYRRVSGSFNGDALIFDILWFDRAKGPLVATPYTRMRRIDPGASTAWAITNGQVTVPTGARYATLRIAIDKAADPGATAEVDTMVLRKTLTTDFIGLGAIWGNQIAEGANISGTKLKDRTLPATKIVAGDLTETELAAGAASYMAVVSAGSNTATTIPSTAVDATTSQSLGGVTISRKAGPLLCLLCIETDNDNASGQSRLAFHVGRDSGSGEAAMAPMRHQFNGNLRTTNTFAWIADDSDSGSATYRWRVYRENAGVGTPRHYRRWMAVLTLHR